MKPRTKLTQYNLKWDYEKWEPLCQLLGIDVIGNCVKADIAIDTETLVISVKQSFFPGEAEYDSAGTEEEA